MKEEPESNELKKLNFFIGWCPTKRNKSMECRSVKTPTDKGKPANKKIHAKRLFRVFGLKSKPFSQQIPPNSSTKTFEK